jgi:hypothetical protein
MSKSKNVRSRYQTVPDHVQARIAVKAGRSRVRTRDSRGAERNALRIVIMGIESHNVTDGDAA